MKRVSIEFIEALKSIVGPENVSCEEVDLIAYSRDWSLMDAGTAYMPDVVVRPRTTLEVAEVVRLANRERIPVIPWGGGTGLSGGALAVRGGIIIDMKGLNRIIEVDEENLLVRTQTGITVQKLNEELMKYGLWWPHDPESKFASTVGAAIACDNAGTFGTRYGGSLVDYLLGIEVVLPTGDIIRLGSKAPHSVSGYPLHWLFVGSEGTLGIITEATLRVYRLPQYRCVDIILFNSFKGAIEAGLRLIEAGLDPESINIIARDGFLYYTRLYEVKFNRPPRVPEDVEAAMAISFGGLKELCDFQRDVALKICREVGGRVVEEKELVDIFWAEKYSLEYESGKNPWHLSQRQYKYAGIDLCVPIGKIPLMYKRYRELLTKYNLRPATGCFMYSKRLKFAPNCVFTVNVNDVDLEEVDRARRFIYELAKYAIELGGTISSSRGVGVAVTRELMPVEHDPVALQLMKRLKQMLDPNGIMNPGKKLPE